MEAEKIIQQAIDSKQKINVIYHGGSMSGQPRELGPISIKGNKLRAKCYKSDAFKTFVIDKIQVITNDGELTEQKAPSVEPTQVVSPEQTLSDVAAAIKPHFKEREWFIDFKELNQSLLIYPRFKNGNPKKSIELAMYYEEYRSDLIFNEQTGDLDEVTIKRVKPWIVKCKNKTAASFGYLNTAAEKFLVWCDEVLENENKQ